MNGLDWLEITILLQGNFTSVFSFGGAAPENPTRGGLQKALLPPLDPPWQRLIMGGVATPFKVQGSNVVIQSKQDNQAPHPTIGEKSPRNKKLLDEF